jgi:predicted SAM-dependent methyltransferase
MKLQVGCSEVRGRYKNPDWINLDIISHAGVEVIGSGFELPFAEDSFEEIHCIHVLEHVTRDKYPVMLGEMYRVAQPDCPVYVETPDFKGVVRNLYKAFERGDYKDIHIWTTSTYGKNERAGMAHFMGFYDALLRKAFLKEGFSEVISLEGEENMISSHYKQEPVLLMKGVK